MYMYQDQVDLGDLNLSKEVMEKIDEAGGISAFIDLYPDLYDENKEAIDLLASMFGEDDDEDDEDTPTTKNKDNLKFKDLYLDKYAPKFSSPSFEYSNQFIKMSPIGGKSSISDFSVTGLFDKMKNGGYVKKYANGGSVSPAYSNYMAVGNHKKIDGIVPVESMIPIQAEQGELIVHPTLDVTTVNAKKRHHKLGDNEVTDIVPEGSYVLSRHGVVRIYKDEADKAVIETENKPYNLYSSNPQPKVKTLGDMMKKKEMSPAELAMDILNKYKIVNHNDPFTEQTNKANKYNSGRYIKSIIELSEFDKARKGISNGENMSEMFSNIPDRWSQNGGYQNKFKYQNWGEVGKAALKLAPTIISGLGSIFGDRASKKANVRGQKLMEDYANKYSSALRQSTLGQLASNAASALAQDTSYNVAKQDLGVYQGLLNRLGSQADRNVFMQDLASASPDYSKMDPRYASALGAQALSNQLRSVSDFNAKQSAADRAAREKYTLGMSQADLYNKQQDALKANTEAMNRNKLLTTLGGQMSGAISDLGTIEANKLALMTGAQKDYLLNEATRRSNLWSNLAKTSQLFSSDDGMSSINSIIDAFKKKPASPNVGVNDPNTQIIKNLGPDDDDSILNRRNGGYNKIAYPKYFFNR